MAACTPSIHVFLGRPLFLLSSGTHSIINLNIQFEIAYSTTVVEFYTTMALVVMMERCNIVSASVSQKQRDISLYRKLT